MSEIARRAAQVLDRIDLAARRSGRTASDVCLVAVSKTFPESAILEAADAGLRDFGENKAQEFGQKVDSFRDNPELRWHFIGHLQRNKAKLVTGRAALVHGLDSARLATAIQNAATRADTTVPCLLQVNVSGEASKFGLSPRELTPVAEQVAVYDRIRVDGLMTLASPTTDESRLRREFGLLRSLGEELRSGAFPDAGILSMGMSGDFELAIEEGATHVRVGSAIFGPRRVTPP